MNGSVYIYIYISANLKEKPDIRFFFGQFPKYGQLKKLLDEIFKD